MTPDLSVSATAATTTIAAMKTAAATTLSQLHQASPTGTHSTAITEDPVGILSGAATERWILQRLHSRTVLVHIYRCISKQIHYKTPLSHNGYLKSLGIYENYITLSGKKQLTFLH
jgi:hypothetical protein